MAAIGESGNSAYFQGGLLDIILADAIISFSDAGVVLPLVDVKGRPNADTINWIRYNQGTHKIQSGDVAATAEGTETPESALTTEKVTATLDMVSINVPLYDEAEISNADSLGDNIGELVGNALAAKADNLLCAAFDNFSTSKGTSTVAITVDNLFEAVESIKSAGGMGQISAVLHPKQVWGANGISNNLVTTNQFGGVLAAQDAMASSGEVGRLAGVDLFHTRELSESSSAVKAGVFTKQALGFGYGFMAQKGVSVVSPDKMFRIERDRFGTYHRDNVVGAMFAGTAEIVDGYGVELWTKTS